MEEVKNKRSSAILNEGKSTVWRYFCLVVDADSNEAVGYVQCKKCEVLMKYDCCHPLSPQQHGLNLDGWTM